MKTVSEALSSHLPRILALHNKSIQAKESVKKNPFVVTYEYPKKWEKTNISKTVFDDYAKEFFTLELDNKQVSKIVLLLTLIYKYI